MPASRQEEPPLNRIFVLRLWRERPGTPWRAALRPGDGAAPLGFADLHQLAAFLLRLADGGEPAKQSTHATTTEADVPESTTTMFERNTQ